MKKIEVISRTRITNYLDIGVIFRFDLPNVLKNDTDSMTKIPEILSARNYGCEGTSPNFIITKNITLQYNDSMTLAQIGATLISAYNAEQAIINSYALNNDDKMLCASWDGTNWTLRKV